MTDTRFGIAGCTGRMGLALVRLIAETPGCVIGGGSEWTESTALGQDIGEAAGIGPVGLPVIGDAGALFASCDVVLDFTTPEATAMHAGLAADTGKALVTGTTGLDSAQQDKLAAAAERAVIVQAANMSLGVNLLIEITRQVAAALDDGFDIEISEMHHRHKVDAPSGTALALGEAAAAGRGTRLDDVAVRGRDGITGERAAGSIGFTSLRGGDVVGDHTVVFAGEGERLELTHRALDRSIFARGAVKAGLWAAKAPPGLYGMADVLGLKG